jgi:TorA maturation chaperone TorD
MPYFRKGKCVYKKNKNGQPTKAGCSDTTSDAKQYLKALYANTIEEYLTTEADTGLSDDQIELINNYFQNAIKQNYQNLFTDYGPKADAVAYGSAVNRAKNNQLDR